MTTINRSLPALLLAKFALEYVVRLVPAGTHDPQKFVRPKELRHEFAAAGIMLDDMTGLASSPAGGFRQTAVWQSITRQAVGLSNHSWPPANHDRSQ